MLDEIYNPGHVASAHKTKVGQLLEQVHAVGPEEGSECADLTAEVHAELLIEHSKRQTWLTLWRA